MSPKKILINLKKFSTGLDTAMLEELKVKYYQPQSQISD